MMLINGRVVGESLDGGNVNVWCKETCYNLTNCILAFMDSHNNCILFDFNSTIHLEIEETDEPLFVAFKTWLPSDSCPIYSEMVPVVKIGEDTIPWTKTSNKFNFLKCSGNWKQFDRSDGITVCIQPFSLNTASSITVARNYCENKGYKMSGLATIDEAQWVFEKMMQFFPNMNYWDGFWIDGRRNCSKPCNNFAFTDGYTVLGDIINKTILSWVTYEVYPEDCLQASNAAENLVNDVECGRTTGMFGVVCGYQVIE